MAGEGRIYLEKIAILVYNIKANLDNQQNTD